MEQNKYIHYTAYAKALENLFIIAKYDSEQLNKVYQQGTDLANIEAGIHDKKLLVNLITKNMPKRPIYNEYGKNKNFRYICPCCGEYITKQTKSVARLLNFLTYCGFCGQRLDWNEDPIPEYKISGILANFSNQKQVEEYFSSLKKTDTKTTSSQIN